MNIEKIVNVVGVFAVIASLIFVGLELRLTRQLAIIDTEWQLMNNYASWNESVIECPECYVANYSEEMGWELVGMSPLREKFDKAADDGCKEYEIEYVLKRQKDRWD